LTKVTILDFQQKQTFMQEALELAHEAFLMEEVPIGAILVSNDVVVGRGFNQTLSRSSVLAHAELIAIEDASKNIGNHRLVDTILFSTIEPCHMCAKAIAEARINHVVFGAKEPNSGALISVDNFFYKNFLNHKVTFEMGVLEKECSDLMKVFFQNKRTK
jgi:tRNA(adenine34) deaminase